MLTEREQEIEQYLKEPTAIGIDKDVALSLLSTIQMLREKIEKYDQDQMEHDQQKRKWILNALEEEDFDLVVEYLDDLIYKNKWLQAEIRLMRGKVHSMS